MNSKMSNASGAIIKNANTNCLEAGLKHIARICPAMDRSDNSIEMQIGIFTGVHARSRNEWEQKEPKQAVEYLLKCLEGRQQHHEWHMLEKASETAKINNIKFQPEEIELLSRTGINMPALLYIATILLAARTDSDKIFEVNYEDAKGNKFDLQIVTYGKYSDQRIDFSLAITKSISICNSNIEIENFPNILVNSLSNRPVEMIIGGGLFDSLNAMTAEVTNENDIVKIPIIYPKEKTTIEDCFGIIEE